MTAYWFIKLLITSFFVIGAFHESFLRDFKEFLVDGWKNPDSILFVIFIFFIPVVMQVLGVSLFDVTFNICEYVYNLIPWWPDEFIKPTPFDIVLKRDIFWETFYPTVMAVFIIYTIVMFITTFIFTAVLWAVAAIFANILLISCVALLLVFLFLFTLHVQKIILQGARSRRKNIKLILFCGQLAVALRLFRPVLCSAALFIQILHAGVLSIFMVCSPAIYVYTAIFSWLRLTAAEITLLFITFFFWLAAALFINLNFFAAACALGSIFFIIFFFMLYRGVVTSRCFVLKKLLLGVIRTLCSARWLIFNSPAFGDSAAFGDVLRFSRLHVADLDNLIRQLSKQLRWINLVDQKLFMQYDRLLLATARSLRQVAGVYKDCALLKKNSWVFKYSVKNLVDLKCYAMRLSIIFGDNKTLTRFDCKKTCQDRRLVRFSRMAFEYIYMVVDIIDRQLRRKHAITNTLNRKTIYVYRVLRVFYRLVERPALLLKNFTRLYLTALGRTVTRSGSPKTLNYLQQLLQLFIIIFSVLLVIVVLFILM